MLDSAGVWLSAARGPKLMRNAGIEVVEALKVNLMRVFYAVWTCANIAR